MNVSKAKSLLATLFVPREGAEGVAFNLEAMKEGSEANPIYRAVSEAQRTSGLTFDFSYEIANRAVNALLELESDCWVNPSSDDSDELREVVESYVPIYNHELMEIYRGNWSIVDEAWEQYGEEGDSVDRARVGWYRAIEDMTQSITANIKQLID